MVKVLRGQRIIDEGIEEARILCQFYANFILVHQVLLG